MDSWEKRKRPNRLEKRLEFSSYEKTRDFLDRLGNYCEKVQRFTDISFGKKYVNITLRPETDDESVEISEADYQFASEIDDLIETP